MGATLLPNGEQQFIDGDGNPYALGTVTFYVPGTTTPKNTWQDQDQVALNTNPIVLDAAGRATIWGVGSYRQILKDADGNTIWDKITSDGGAGATTVTNVTAADSPYQVKITDTFLVCDCSAGAIEIDLYNATMFSVVSLTVKKSDSSSNIVTIDGFGAQTIDGATIQALPFANQAISMVSNKVSKWYTF